MESLNPIGLLFGDKVSLLAQIGLYVAVQALYAAELELKVMILLPQPDSTSL